MALTRRLCLDTSAYVHFRKGRASVVELLDGAEWVGVPAITVGELTTGFLLAISEAVKCFHNPSFWVKMITLPFALLFTFAVRQRLSINTPSMGPWRRGLLATVSLALWFTVAMAGRWIGYSS